MLNCRHRIFPGLLLTLLISGCGAVRKVEHPGKTLGQALGHPATLNLTVDISKDANEFHPVLFDVVLAKDKKLLKQLSAMTAKKWFEQSSQIQRDFQNKIQVNSWEWVPGQAIDKLSVPVTVGVLGVFGFAGYSTSGDHRLPLPLSGSVNIDLQKSDIGPLPVKK